MVELPGLLLAKAVESLVLRAFEAYTRTPCVLALNRYGLEGSTPVTCKEITLAVIEVNAAIGLVHVYCNRAGGKVHLAHGVGHLVVRAWPLRQHSKGLAVVELSVRGLRDAHYLRAYDLEAHGAAVGSGDNHFRFMAGNKSKRQDGQNNAQR